jgi:hypothetical protein
MFGSKLDQNIPVLKVVYSIETELPTQVIYRLIHDPVLRRKWDGDNILDLVVISDAGDTTE